MNRTIYIDNAKGMGLLFIMFGHTANLPNLFYNYAFSFHVPLFFFISGALLSNKLSNGKLSLKIRILVMKLVVPFLFFFSVSYLLWVFRRVIGVNINNEDVAILSPLTNLILGNSSLTIVNSTLWYFICVFNIFILYFIIDYIFKCEYFNLFISFILIFFVLNISDYESLNFYIGLSIISLPFFCLGRFEQIISLKRNARPFIFYLLLLFYSCLVILNGKVDMAKYQFGDFLYLFYLNAFVGIYIVLYISENIKIKAFVSFFNWMSKNSIVIFPMHILIFSILKFFLVSFFGYDILLQGGFLISFVYISLTLILIYFILMVWPNKVKFLLGK